MADKKHVLYQLHRFKILIVIALESQRPKYKFGFYLDQVYYVVLVAFNKEAEEHKLVYQGLFPTA